MRSLRSTHWLLTTTASVSILSLSCLPAPAQTQQSAPQNAAQSQVTQNSACSRLVDRLERGIENAPVTVERARRLQADNNLAECRRLIQQIRVASGELKSRIVVQQSAPEVTVDQASPQVTVQQPQPNVTVRQATPQIIVRQPPPVITVQQAQPEIIVRMPDPEVDVAMPQPGVTVSQPEPQVQLVEPEQRAQLQVEQAEPQVQVEQAEPVEPTIERAGQPRVEYQQTGEPRIVMQQSGQQPTIRFERIESTDEPSSGSSAPQSVATNSQEASVGSSTIAQAPSQDTATEQGDASSQPRATATPSAALSAQSESDTTTENRHRIIAENLVDLEIWNGQGEQLGSVERVVRDTNGRDQVILSFGGFLGLGEREVAVPVGSLRWAGDRLIMSGTTEQELRSMPTVEGSSTEWTDVRDDEAILLNR